jgi:hypothetical protein
MPEATNQQMQQFCDQRIRPRRSSTHHSSFVLHHFLPLLAIVLCVACFTPELHASFDAGINFRATSGYVTDGANETYCLADAYPTTRGGVTFGWLDAVANDAQNRNSSLDRRLAGINAAGVANTDVRFQIDLPSAGTYDVHLALGDGNTTGVVCKATVKDGSTVLFSTTQNGFVSGNKWIDAQDQAYAASAWPASESAHPITMSGTTLLIVINGSSFASIAHVRVVQTGTGGGSASPNRPTANLSSNLTSGLDGTK